MAKLNPMPYVRRGVTEGLSGRASYRQFLTAARAEGLTGIRLQDYQRLHAETLGLRGLAQSALSQPKDRVPTESEIQSRTTKFSTGYGTWVLLYQRTVGESDLIEKPFLVKSSVPITPQEAEQQALDWLSEGEDQYGRIVLGVSYAGTERFVPE